MCHAELANPPTSPHHYHYHYSYPRLSISAAATYLVDCHDALAS